MIVGNGLIASAFKPYFLDDPKVVVFASGVSNSREINREAYLRERKMLIQALSYEGFLLYFSTCSVNDPQLMESAYVVHKKEMEDLVSLAVNYAIFRLPQVVGKTPNQHTLSNYLWGKVISGEHFQIWKYAKRNLIDIDDVVSIVRYLVNSSLANGITENIASPYSIHLPELVRIFELVLKKKANYTTIDSGAEYLIDATLATEAARHAGVDFDEAYIEKLIRKYYGE